MRREFKWTKQRVQAAALLAEDELSDEKIAATVGVWRNTIAMWKLDPVFGRRIQDHVSTWQRKVMSTGIANKVRRIDTLNYLHNLHLQIMEKRSAKAKAPKDASAPFPGAETGLLNERDGLFDHGLSREIRATLEQAAKEMRHVVAKSKEDSREMDEKPVKLSIAFIDEIMARVEAEQGSASE